MNRGAVHSESEGQRPAVGEDEIQIGRFGNHTAVDPVGIELLQGGERSEPTILLAAHRTQDDVASQIDAGFTHNPEGLPRGDEACLHVTRAAGHHAWASVHVEDAGNEGVTTPRAQVSGWHHVGVPVDQECPTTAGSR